MKEPTYHCPECDSEQVTTEHHQMFMRNTGEHYCHSMKTHDGDSPATCLDCKWTGEGHQLKEKNTTDLEKAARQALEALGEIEWSNNSQWQSDRAKVAITSLRQAIAEAEKQGKIQTVDSSTERKAD